MKPIKRLPKSIGEYAGALTQAQNEGAAHALEIVLYVMVDKFGWDVDQVKTLMDHVANQVQAVTQGYITVHDIRTVLREEYQIEV